PPTIRTATLLPARGLQDAVDVKGTVSRGATLTADGRPVHLDTRGRFAIHLAKPPVGPVVLAARDRAGQTTKVQVFAPVRRPLVRAVHSSGVAWADPARRAAILA